MKRKDVEMKKMFALTLMFLLIGLSLNVHAYTVLATETASGEYENGNYSKFKPEVIHRFEIDEENGVAKRTEYISIKDNSIIEDWTTYKISYVGGWDLLRAKNKQNQKVIVITGMPGTHAVEVIIIGEDFFEYSKATSGRLYVASGNVKRSVSASEDLKNKFK